MHDVFATIASFKRCTVLHSAFPVCTTIHVFQANSTRTLALAPSRPLQTTRTITQYPRGCWIQEGTRYTPRRTTTVKSEMDFARSVLYRRSIWNHTGRASFFALDNCGNVRWECRFNVDMLDSKSVVTHAHTQFKYYFTISSM